MLNSRWARGCFTLITFGLALLARSTFANESTSEVMQFEVSAWSSDCTSAGVCGLPIALAPSQTIGLTIAIPPAPEQGTSATLALPFATSALTGRLKVYSVMPRMESGLPRYYQIQLELASPAHGFCAMSPRANWGILPPLVCAADGPEADGKFRRYGVTLISRAI